MTALANQRPPMVLQSPPATPIFDLSLYLVTSSDLLPSGATLESHVEAAIKGGVTIVQLREKKLDTRPFIDLGKHIHAITKKYGVPLLINDRVDVALAVGCEGAHIGWDDMEYQTARTILGPTAIIGLSVSNIEQASLAASTTCNYIGIGPVFATATKPNANAPLYPSGVRAILEFLRTKRSIPAVAIGSINSGNVQSVAFKSRPADGPGLDGVAVVSAIIASEEPEKAAAELVKLFESTPTWSPTAPQSKTVFTLDNLNTTISAIKTHKPLVHHITNDVVKNFSANMALAIGASPIMSENPEEMADLANISPYSSTLLNMGTSGPAKRAIFALAIKENNKAGKPIVFDPVGGGATKMRRETVKFIIEQTGYVDVVKGNEGEIRTWAGEGVQMRGVDSGASAAGGIEELVTLVKALAQREKNVIVLTGPTDIISDGLRTVLVHNGHPYQGLVTGVGCSLGSVLCAALAVNKEDRLLSCLAGILAFNIAAERAAAAEDVKGPGSFMTRFLDEIYQIGELASKSDSSWTEASRLEFR